jgi:hypothetical protein
MLSFAEQLVCDIVAHDDFWASGTIVLERVIVQEPEDRVGSFTGECPMCGQNCGWVELEIIF